MVQESAIAGKKEYHILNKLRIVALGAGQEWYADGNPGIEANLEHLATLAETSIGVDPDVIVFPEFATTGWPYPTADVVAASAEMLEGNGPIWRRYAQAASRAKAILCAWLVEKDDDGRLYNTVALVSPDGRCLGAYRKTHLTLGEEGEWGLSAGSEIPVFNLGSATIGICTCFDMDFPEVARTLMLGGADVIIHPTIADDRRDMNPVRAKENALPIVVSVFQGGSYAVDGYGVVTHEAGAGNGGSLLCDVDISNRPTMPRYGYTADKRERFRSRRRPDLYGLLTDPSVLSPFGTGLTDKNGNAVTPEEIRVHFPRL